MLILASKSPRRCQLLSELGIEFKVVPSTKDEVVDKLLPPCEVVKSLAKSKALDVFEKENSPCLAADTIVVLDGKILGKPANKSINAQYLRKLSNRYHEVYTGYCFYDGKKLIVDYDVAKVKFNNLSDDLIESYVESGSGLDKAGGYGIQDKFNLVEKIDGSYSCVVGLPMEKVSKLLKEVL